jgi:hypothetical protein
MNTVKPRTTVRMNNEEYQKIKQDSDYSGETIPTLFKKSYFKNNFKIYSQEEKEDLKKLKSELSRLGNNLNQIARKLNSGLVSGWNTSFDQILKEFNKINQVIEAR